MDYNIITLREDEEFLIEHNQSKILRLKNNLNILNKVIKYIFV